VNNKLNVKVALTLLPFRVCVICLVLSTLL